MDLRATEQHTYTDMWALDAYAAHSPGETLLPLFLSMVGSSRGTVLDAGTGSGKGALALQAEGFAVTLCDLTDAGLTDEARALPFVSTALWDDLSVAGRHRWVYCCDVMEHIPPAFTMLVVRRLLDVAEDGVFFTISLVPDVFGAWVGKSLHQSVQSFTAWRDQLATVGDIIEARDLLTTGVYYVRAKC